jgi:hypothetical protein
MIWLYEVLYYDGMLIFILVLHVLCFFLQVLIVMCSSNYMCCDTDCCLAVWFMVHICMVYGCNVVLIDSSYYAYGLN